MDITITTFRNRKNPAGELHTMSWEELVDNFREPHVTDEFFSEYCSMTNEQRTEIKDVGGYVCGEFEGNKRSKAGLKFRTVLTIDADDAAVDSVDSYECLYPYVFLCHSTHSHSADSPRLRWLFPLTRPVTADEYRQLVNIVVQWIGAETIDESTDQPERLMFWPSVSADADYLFRQGGADILDPDVLLDNEDLPAEPIPAPEIPAPRKTEEGLVIGEGRRNKVVFGFASTLRGMGLDRDGIRSMAEDYSDRYCDPPLDAAELDTIVRSVCNRYAPGDPVVNSLRDAWDDFNDLGEWKESDPKSTTMSMESASSLNGRYVAPPEYIVPGLLATGLNIVASPPKFGKSWMMMDLAISVATGTPFMGMDVRQDGVIYLALEDGDHRIKDRMLKVAGSRAIPDNLFFVQTAPTLGDDLLKQLSELITSSGCHIGLLIVDTLQKVRGVAGKTEGVYGYDYRELGKFKNFVDANNLCGVFVHHLNKGGDDADFVSRLNGSTGVSGAADAIITLTRAKRKDSETKMSITGRDVTERTLVIQMDWSTYRWMILGDERDVEKDQKNSEFYSDPLVKTVIRRIEEAEELIDPEGDVSEVAWSCTSSELLDEVTRLYGEQEYTATGLGMKVKKLQPMLEALEGIVYEYQRQTSRRLHVFTRELV